MGKFKKTRLTFFHKQGGCRATPNAHKKAAPFTARPRFVYLVKCQIRTATKSNSRSIKKEAKGCSAPMGYASVLLLRIGKLALGGVIFTEYGGHSGLARFGIGLNLLLQFGQIGNAYHLCAVG